MLLNLFHDPLGFGCGADELLLLPRHLLLLLFLHLGVTTLGSRGILLFLLLFGTSAGGAIPATKLGFIFLGPVLSLELAALEQRLLQLVRAELKHVEDLREGDLPQNLGLTGLRAADITSLLPVEANEVNAEVFRLQTASIDTTTTIISGENDAMDLRVY